MMSIQPASNAWNAEKSTEFWSFDFPDRRAYASEGFLGQAEWDVMKWA